MGGDVESAAPPAANFMQDFFNQVAGVKRDMETVHGNIRDLEEKQNKAITDVYGGKGAPCEHVASESDGCCPALP